MSEIESLIKSLSQEDEPQMQGAVNQEPGLDEVLESYGGLKKGRSHGKKIRYSNGEEKEFSFVD